MYIAIIIFVLASVCVLMTSFLRWYKKSKKAKARYYADLGQFFFVVSIFILWTTLYYTAPYLFSDLDKVLCLQALTALCFVLYAAALESDNSFYHFIAPCGIIILTSFSIMVL